LRSGLAANEFDQQAAGVMWRGREEETPAHVIFQPGN
jgi:hypothetical protein